MSYKPTRSRNAPAQPLTTHTKAVIHEALHALPDPSRRAFLANLGRSGLSIGAFSLLGGFALTRPQDIQAMLTHLSTLNDQAQARLFSGQRLAPTYPAHLITQPFPFNAYYPQSQAPQVPAETYALQLAGLIRNKTPWTVAQLQALHRVNHTTRHVCVEGWSAIGNWGGIPLGTFLTMVGADLRAPYVHFRCADDYYTTIDMPTALHPQTLLATHFMGQPIPAAYGFPFKVRIPTKLGFKNPKYVTSLEVTRHNLGGYWEDQGYNWFAGL